MSQNRFNQYTSQGDSNVTDGSLDIWGYTLRASNLNPGQSLKTNSINQLISSKLDISDINNLQTQLNATIQTPYNDGDIVITNGNIVSQDVVTDTITSLNNTITNIESSITDKVSKTGDTMSGNLNMGGNSILGVFQMNVDELNERTLGAGIYTNNTLYTKDIIVTDSHKIKTDTIEETTLTGGLTIQSDLHMNNKNIDNIASITASTLISTALQTGMIQNQTPATPIDISSSLNLLSVSLNGASNVSTSSIDCDSINPLSSTTISLNGDLDMNTTYGITNVNGIDTNTIITDTIAEKTISGGVSVLDSGMTITNVNVPALATPLLTLNSNYIANPATIKLKTDIHEGYTLQTDAQMITASSTNILIQSDDDEIKLSTGGGAKSLIIDNSLSYVKIQDYNLDMNTVNNINKCNILETQQIKATDGVSINYDNNIEMQQNEIRSIKNTAFFYNSDVANIGVGAGNLEIAGINCGLNIYSGPNKSTALSINDGNNGIYLNHITNNLDINSLNLNLNNNSIENCNELKTDNLTSSTTNKIIINNDLDFQNTYNLLNIDSINNIRPSGGLYSQSNLTQFTQTTETNMLGGSNTSGSLTIPANTFKQLAVYSFKSSGILSGGSNDLFTLRLKSSTGASFAELPVTITDNGLVGNWWDLSADFCINTLGSAGVALLVSTVVFRYINNTNVVSTRAVSNINNTTFDTTILNTLEFTFQNDATNPLTFLQMNVASFTQWY